MTSAEAKRALGVGQGHIADKIKEFRDPFELAPPAIEREGQFTFAALKAIQDDINKTFAIPPEVMANTVGQFRNAVVFGISRPEIYADFDQKLIVSQVPLAEIITPPKPLQLDSGIKFKNDPNEYHWGTCALGPYHYLSDGEDEHVSVATKRGYLIINGPDALAKLDAACAHISGKTSTGRLVVASPPKFTSLPAMPLAGDLLVGGGLAGAPTWASSQQMPEPASPPVDIMTITRGMLK